MIPTHVDEAGRVRMVDVGAKPVTARTARAAARVVCSDEALEHLRTGTLAKGDAVAVARVAGLMAVKRTSDLIPLCHPLAVDGAEVDVVVDDAVRIETTVRTTGRTGVEMEALTAAAVAALAVVDMIKSVDRGAQVTDVRLLAKSGGASGAWELADGGMARTRALPPAAVITISDRCALGVRLDLAGPRLVDALRGAGAVDVATAVVPDEVEKIREQVSAFVAAGRGLVLTTGGTGVGPRDVTPEAVEPLIERPVPGLAEAVRSAGAVRTGTAALSRGVAGVIGDALVITLPGAPSAVDDAMDRLAPLLSHAVAQLRGGGHEEHP
ncbi:MAG: bifunctional molybdenum cofactor biosynthesis protein MoaC/MoaB [Micrococcales bacterium]|nr:bifunctional molybdenum cofactor biosynthesis protein MoaC/MoaB [Micrococcales bacterium]